MTADAVPRRSPLAAYADRLADATRAAGGDLILQEIPFLAQVNLRLDPKNKVADEVGLALGVPLPTEPGTSTGPGTSAGPGDGRGSGDLRILWLGPDEWLLLGPDGSARDAETLVRAAVGDEPASVVDVSAQRTVLLVAGPRARDLLAHGCSIDLHPRVFTEGRCAQTMLARAQVVILALAGSSYWVLVRSSFAGYLAEWLLDAATEYIDRTPP